MVNLSGKVVQAVAELGKKSIILRGQDSGFSMTLTLKDDARGGLVSEMMKACKAPSVMQPQKLPLKGKRFSLKIG